jgi:hypothetical protein
MGQLVWQNCSFRLGDGVMFVGLYFGTLIPLFLLTRIGPALCEIAHFRSYRIATTFAVNDGVNSSTQPVKPVVLPRCE